MSSLADTQSFGGIDADVDDLLDACFQDHEAYLKARAHDRPLVIGRKGSGKTAIFRRIIQIRDPHVFAFGHTFADYPWQHHHIQAAIGVPEEQRYVHSWKYLILLTAAKILLNQDQSQPWSEDGAEKLSKLESFVVDSYGSRDPDVTQLLYTDETSANPSTPEDRWLRGPWIGFRTLSRRRPAEGLSGCEPYYYFGRHDVR